MLGLLFGASLGLAIIQLVLLIFIALEDRK